MVWGSDNSLGWAILGSIATGIIFLVAIIAIPIFLIYDCGRSSVPQSPICIEQKLESDNWICTKWKT